MPYSRTALGFLFAVAIDLWICLSFVFVTVAASTVYINVYSHIKACVGDSLMIVTESNGKVDQKLAIQRELQQFVAIHLFCYRYEHFAYAFAYNIIIVIHLLG